MREKVLGRGGGRSSTVSLRKTHSGMIGSFKKVDRQNDVVLTGLHYRDGDDDGYSPALCGAKEDD